MLPLFFVAAKGVADSIDWSAAAGTPGNPNQQKKM
tara:strand:+ start:1328 stop:1432 length:105 start_codon:yes stop_codon:yes gene_type:complete